MAPLLLLPEPSPEPEANAATSKSKTASAPWIALLSLITSLACVGGAIAVILSSNGQVAKSWVPSALPVQPSVLLAVLSGVFNAAQALALSGGVVIVWWRATQRGASLSGLHHIWNKGEWRSLDGFRRGFRSDPWGVGRVVLAFLLTILASIACNPLLQKGTRAAVEDSRSMAPWLWSIHQNIPDGWTGLIDPLSPANLTASIDLQKIAESWYNNMTLGGFWGAADGDWRTANAEPWRGVCQGECSATVPGAGVRSNCTTRKQYLDLTAPENSNATLFNLSFSRIEYDDEPKTPILQSQLMYSSKVDSSCNATISIDTCHFRLAHVDYDIIVSGDYSSLDWWTYASPSNFSVGDRVNVKAGLPAGPLTGLHWIGHHYFASSAKLSHPAGSRDYSAVPTGPWAMLYAKKDTSDRSNLAPCAFEWSNATSDVVWIMNEFMLRMAVSSAAGRTSEYQFIDVRIERAASTIVYRSDTAFLWAAVAIMLATLLSTSSLLWKFWDIPRAVTLSPLETAMALVDIMSHTEVRGKRFEGADDLVDGIGDRRVGSEGEQQEVLKGEPREKAN